MIIYEYFLLDLFKYFDDFFKTYEISRNGTVKKFQMKDPEKIVMRIEFVSKNYFIK
jgi:hypothetical protein